METYQVICPSPQQFQQPPRLLHNEHDSETYIQASQNRFPYQYSSQFEESSKDNRYVNEDEGEDGDGDDLLELVKGLILNEADVKGHEMFEKFAARVEEGVPVKRVIRETLHDFRGKIGSDMLGKLARKLNKGGGEEDLDVRERGVDGEELQGEKLERFKVQTVNTIGGGVVKEEGK